MIRRRRMKKNNEENEEKEFVEFDNELDWGFG